MRSTSSHRLAIVLLAALSGACGCGNALANVTYRLELSGQAVHQLDCWEVPHVCDPDYPPPPKEVVYPWMGLLDLTVASGGDGTFGEPDLLAVDLVSNLATFSVPGAYPPPFGGILWPFSGTVTVVGGKVTSLDGSDYLDPFASDEYLVTFSGLSAQLYDPGGHHTGPTEASANLVMVAEPPAWLLLLSAISPLLALRARPVASALRAILRLSPSPSRSAPAA